MPGKEMNVCLRGQQAEWSAEFHRGIGQVWELQYLLAKTDASSVTIHLHTTPKTTRHKLERHQLHAAEILSHFEETYLKRNLLHFDSIRKLLEAKHTGLAKVLASIYSFVFYFEESEFVVTLLDIEEKSEKLKQFSENCVYLGCSTCTRQLNQDSNGIYGQCMYCVSNNVSYTYSCSYFYKPFQICLHDKTGMIMVHICSRTASKLLAQMPAKVFSRKKGDFPNEDFGILLKNLLCRKSQEYAFACHATFDENSFVEQRTFNLCYNF